MTIQTFIEKAIEGGWEGNEYKHRLYVLSGQKNAYPSTSSSIPFTEMLLDPEAWKAVGKVEGWGTKAICNDCGNERPERYDLSCSPHRDCNLTSYNYSEMWLVNMHRMIDALAEGKTIEQYLETL